MNIETAKKNETVARAEGHQAFVIVTDSQCGPCGTQTSYAIQFENADYTVAHIAKDQRHALDYISRTSCRMH